MLGTPANLYIFDSDMKKQVHRSCCITDREIVAAISMPYIKLSHLSNCSCELENL